MSSNPIDKNKMHMEDFLKPLESIKQIEASPYLFTRIQQRIQNKLDNRVPMRTAYSMAASFVILLSINAFVLMQNNNTKMEETNIAESFQLMHDNNLYK